MLIQSERVQKALALSNQPFKRLFGVKKETFHIMPESTVQERHGVSLPVSQYQPVSIDLFHNLQNAPQMRWSFSFLAKNREVFSD